MGDAKKVQHSKVCCAVIKQAGVNPVSGARVIVQRCSLGGGEPSMVSQGKLWTQKAQPYKLLQMRKSDRGPSRIGGLLRVMNERRVRIPSDILYRS